MCPWIPLNVINFPRSQVSLYHVLSVKDNVSFQIENVLIFCFLECQDFKSFFFQPYLVNLSDDVKPRVG